MLRDFPRICDAVHTQPSPSFTPTLGRTKGLLISGFQCIYKWDFAQISSPFTHPTNPTDVSVRRDCSSNCSRNSGTTPSRRPTLLRRRHRTRRASRRNRRSSPSQSVATAVWRRRRMTRASTGGGTTAWVAWAP